jgi:hypothetical protein
MIELQMTSAMVASQQNPRSGRWAVVADEGSSVWLYMTDREGTQPVADCWLLNTVPAPTKLKDHRERKSAPPVPIAYASPASLGPVPAETAVAFEWSEDGDSVSVSVSGVVLGFIAAGGKRGFSRHLVAGGPFGQPLDEELHARLFRPSRAEDRRLDLPEERR